MTAKTMTPDTNRTAVKLAPSATPLVSAKRAKTEFPANAMSANRVKMVVLAKDWVIEAPESEMRFLHCGLIKFLRIISNDLSRQLQQQKVQISNGLVPDHGC
jgi:hypothetical protein